MTSSPWLAHATSRRLIRCVVLAAVYFAAGKVGLSLAALNASTSAIWPPTGIALAALLVLGRELWPGVALGAFLVNLSTTGVLSASLVIAAGNTLEALVGATLVRAYTGRPGTFESPAEVFAFAGLAGGVASTASATIGVSALLLSGLAPPADAVPLWVTWWLGDCAGAVVYGPALITWWLDRRPRTRREIVETVLVILTLTAVSLLVFGGFLGASRANYPLGFFCLPIALWPVFRLGQRETALGAVILSATAVWGTLQRFGPFGAGGPNHGLLVAQLFAAVIAVTTGSMAALVAERKRLYEQLELRVSERTEQLRLSNRDLLAEIANREQIQSELKTSEGRLLEAQAVAHVGSWEWEIATGGLVWSEELYRIYGLDRASFVVSYESFLSRVHPDDRPMLVDRVAEALERRGTFAVEHRTLRPDGTVRVLAGRGRVVCNDKGEPVRMLGTGQDITERKHAEEQRRLLLDEQAARRQAEAASRTKDEFLAMVSHELRTPLNAVLGWAQMLSAGALDEAGTRKALQIIERNALMQARLIDDLLDVSRFVTGQAVLSLQPLPIEGVLRSAVDAILPAAAARRVRIEYDALPDATLVDADAERLQQVVANLLSNAVKFTPEDGTIRVEVMRDEATVQLRVTDTGRGIAPADLPRVFEPFWQVDTTLTRTESGLGLGLAIVRYLVEAHGGTVEAESDGLGLGASFIVKLPLARGASVHEFPGAREAAS